MAKKAVKKKSSFGVVTILLIVLLAIRIAGQIVSMFFAPIETAYVVTYLIFAGIYLIAMVGVFLKKKFGVIVALVLGVFDLIAALSIGGFQGISAGVIDIVLLFLAYKEFQILRN